MLEQSQTCARASGDSTPLLRRVSGFWLSKGLRVPGSTRALAVILQLLRHIRHIRLAVVDALPHWAGGCGGSGCCSQLANQSAGRPESPAFRPPPGGETGFFRNFAFRDKFKMRMKVKMKIKIKCRVPSTHYVVASG